MHEHPGNETAKRATAALLGTAVLAFTVLAWSGCSGDGSSAPATGSAPDTAAADTIPQPALDDPRIAPAGRRVDLAMPTFATPTTVTNPLFPVSRQKSALLLGQVDGEPFRTEVTLLPETRIIEWRGLKVETLVSQYVAFLDGRLHEVAYDFYAQDDDGAVWYFGEDVFNFRDGAIVDTHGTWLAGRDGPAAMIMPAEPQPGDVYRPENIPGLVFEEVTVESVGRTLAGPLGPVEGGLVVEELHLLDSATEAKTFAPGYGEFLTGGDGDVEALTLAVPTDALGEAAPAELRALENEAAAVFDAAQAADWRTAQSAAAHIASAWKTVKAGELPARLEPQLALAVESVAAAAAARRAPAARQAAIDVARWSLDLQLRYRPVAEVDLARFDLWAAQLLADAARGDGAAVNGDSFALDYVRDRIRAALDPTDLVRLDTELDALSGAVADEDLEAAAQVAERLRETVAGLSSRG